MNLIQLTLAEDAKLISLEDSSIIRVIADTLGAVVVYSRKGARPRKIVVTDTPVQIEAMNSGQRRSLILVTHTDSGAEEYINYERMIDHAESGTGSVFMYNDEGATLKKYVVDEDYAAIAAAIAAL